MMSVIHKSSATPRRSAQNVQRLLYLIDQLQTRDIGYAGAAELLRCSRSRARQYLHELLSNDIILHSPRMMAQDSPDERGLCLNPHQTIVRRFVAELRGQAGSAASPRNDVAREHSSPVEPTQRDVWRDPLIVALFGPAPGRSA
jgi:hypothetical protein